MLRIAALVPLLVMLAACQTTKATPPVIVPKNVVWRIPEEFLHCTRVYYPDAETLTDAQVAKLIVALERANNECRLNMDSIRRLQSEAIKQLEGKP